jgi:hypothetical protein
MDNEAQTPAMARLERAIESLEAAVSDRRQADAATDMTASNNSRESEDLARRHDALKSVVAACIEDIDALLSEEGRENA